MSDLNLEAVRAFIENGGYEVVTMGDGEQSVVPMDRQPALEALAQQEAELENARWREKSLNNQLHHAKAELERKEKLWAQRHEDEQFAALRMLDKRDEQIGKLEAELERLREALRVYADGSTWGVTRSMILEEEKHGD